MSKEICPVCKGSGKIKIKDAATCENPWIECKWCHGTGEIKKFEDKDNSE